MENTLMTTNMDETVEQLCTVDTENIQRRIVGARRMMRVEDRNIHSAVMSVAMRTTQGHYSPKFIANIVTEIIHSETMKIA